MNFSDLEAFNQALKLAEYDNPAAANAILERLRDANPGNSRLLLCSVFTATDATQARLALELASATDPTHPSLPAARNWLAHLEAKEAKERQHPTTTATIWQDIPDQPTSEWYSLFIAPAPATAKKRLIRFSRLTWILGLLLLIQVLVGVWLISLLQQTSGFSEAEKSYGQAVRRINEQASAANNGLRELARQDTANPLIRLSLQSQLQVFVRLNEQFRELRSPSVRFEQLDRMLGLAYGYYGEGAAFLIEGLQTTNQGLIERGNRLLETGNDFLRQARDELAKL